MRVDERGPVASTCRPMPGRCGARRLPAALPIALMTALMTALLGGMAGCMTVTEGAAPAAAAPPARAGGDLVTASDESDAAKRARIRLELASAYFAQGQTQTALDEVKRVLAIDPDHASALNLRGLIYASLGENALADESFRRSLSLRGDDPDALHNHGWFLCRQGRFAEARQRFEAALAQPRYREPARTLLAQGVCEAAGGDLAAAERLLLRSYELDAGNPVTAFNLAEVLLRRNDLERARFYLQRVNQMPEWVNAQTLWLAARIERRRGNAAGVEEWGQQLRSRYPNARETAAYEQGKFDD